MEISRKAKSALIFGLLIFIVISITCSVIAFHRHVSAIFQTTVLNSISEIQELHKETLREQFSAQFSMLEAQARYFKGINLDDDEELKKIISSTRGIGDFKKIAVVNDMGVCINYTGASLSNISTKDYFKNTFLSGRPQVSDKIELDDSLEPILTLTYPLKKDDAVKAMIIGTLPYKALKKQFSVSLFSGKNYVYIITHDGNIILSNRDKNKSLYNVNIYDYLKTNSIKSDQEINQMRTDIICDSSGYINYHGRDAEKIFAYAPLEMNEWYIISVIPSSYIQEQRYAFSNLVIRLFFVLALAIAVFLLILASLLKRNSTVEKDNERLTIANNQTQSLIFEYDIQKGTIEFSGDAKFILGTDRKTISPDVASTEYFKRVHDDDKSVLELLQDTITGKNSDFLGEFRYKDFENEFIWVRMTGTLIRKEDQKTPAKFIGSINNVNAQMMHEQELRSIAEVDALTTLLNKNAMQEHSSAFLEEKDKETFCALFMLDLDNFKMVNDTLGHLAGDKAIKDAAKKLSLIFSEKDFISRFGGDEFCILLRVNENMGKETFMRVVNEKAKNLCLLLKEKYYDEKDIVEVSASVGIALCPENGTTYKDLFHSADDALYQVKQNGKNGWKIASSDSPLS
ncbi:MAG: diguanylate cyclase [Treponema sp.]|nr:diguanylate cyclase [Treponema sp.]